MLPICQIAPKIDFSKSMFGYHHISTFDLIVTFLAQLKNKKQLFLENR